MAQYLEMDPTTQDYVFNKGSPIPSDRILEAAYFALTVPKNAWLYGVLGQGSLLYTLEGIKRTPSVEQQFASFAKDAINLQLVNTGQAQGVGVKNLEVSRTGTSNQIEVIPTATQIASQLEFNPV